MALPALHVSLPPSLEGPTQEALVRVGRRLRDPRVDAELRASLGAYWEAMLEAHERRRCSGRVAGAQPAWWSTVAGLLLAAATSEGDAIDDRLLDAAAGCELYVISLTLFDAVEDDELELEGPMAELGPAVTLNAALVVFVLACEALLCAADRLPAEQQPRIRESLVNRSLVMGRGQHRDLRCVRAQTLEQAVAQAQDKTEAIALAAELGALAAGCDVARAQRYALLGRRSALLRQCGNDLADLYGQRDSVDLRTGKWTLPLVALWEHADPATRQELLRLRDALPGSLPQIRRLVFDTGAVRRVALVMERARREIHSILDDLGRRDDPIAMLGAHADLTASRLYTPAGAR
ncbi:MAG: polyprenyl synthetase family protein [Myxococcales bacterium]|nr:polyprenyl synthetase family protein [Myxococcales bacterium]